MNGGTRTCDPLTADAAATLETLTVRWAAVYRVDYDGTRWLAARKDETGDVLCGLTADDLEAAIQADWCTWPRGNRDLSRVRPYAPRGPR